MVQERCHHLQGVGGQLVVPVKAGVALMQHNDTTGRHASCARGVGSCAALQADASPIFWRMTHDA